MSSASGLHFNPADPFPNLNFLEAPYKEAQAHATQVDEWLGFDFEAAEARISKSDYLHDSDDVQIWQGLPVQALQTPYIEIRYMLELLQPRPGEKIIDLGSGYGRMAHVVGRCFPQIHFEGYEIVRERHQEAARILKKFDYPLVKIFCDDISRKNFRLPQAEFYFIFDFGSRAAIEKTLEDLKALARNKKITLIARGRGIRHHIYQSHPWLSSVHPPEDYAHFTIFRS